MKKIHAIVARSNNNVIGVGDDLPWHLPKDMRRFVRLTKGNTVVMGRKTYQSIGKPLQDRENIVLSRVRGLELNGCTVCHSIEECIDSATNDNIFVIGGAEIYKLFDGLYDTIYLTDVHIDIDAENSVEFPSEILDEYVDTSDVIYHPRDEDNPHNMTFLTLKKP